MENDAGNSIFPPNAGESKSPKQEIDTRTGAADVVNAGAVPGGTGDRVNPSAPTTGTEGWGSGPGEEDIAMTNVAINNPPASRSKHTPEHGQPQDIREDDLRKRSDKMAS